MLTAFLLSRPLAFCSNCALCERTFSQCKPLEEDRAGERQSRRKFSGKRCNLAPSRRVHELSTGTLANFFQTRHANSIFHGQVCAREFLTVPDTILVYQSQLILQFLSQKRIARNVSCTKRITIIFTSLRARDINAAPMSFVGGRKTHDSFLFVHRVT